MSDREKLLKILNVPIYPHENIDPLEAVADYLLDNDVVPVVRCKDCKYRGDDVHCPMCFEEVIEIDEGDGYWDTDYITHDRTIDEGFCDRGERKDNER